MTTGFSLSWKRVGQAMLAPHSLAGSLGWTTVVVIVPTLLRYALDGGANGVPFVTYFPAIVLAGLFLGWRYGILSAILCSATARLLFMQDAPRLGQSVEGLAILGMFVASCAALLAIAEALRRTVAQLTAASAREALLNAELRHRLKNMLGTVGSLAALNRRHTDPQTGHAAFNDRLAALSRAVDLLGAEGPDACALPELAEEALRPFMPDYDIRLDGPHCTVDRESCMPAVLALHELSTNAIKYGSLSVAGGWVELGWRAPDGDEIKACWRERGGPAVGPPTRKGMGSRILSMRSHAARFALDLPPDGAVCDIVLKCGPRLAQT